MSYYSKHKLEAEIERLQAWIECIERTTDEEIGCRFRTSSYKTEEQMAGKSTIYTMLSVPRNMARRALAGDPYLKPAPVAAKQKMLPTPKARKR